jgi:hypothetical protein
MRAGRPGVKVVRPVCHEREGRGDVGIFRSGAVQEMEDSWPSGVGLRGLAPNHPVLRWLKTVVVSDREKAYLIRQVGTRKTFQSAW